MSRQYLSAYAQHFLKFLQAYAAEGVPIQAITMQNEIDTDQHGQMPARTWSQECDMEFIIEHLGPLFEKTNTSTKIWILDHNFIYWGRVISELDDPEFRRYTNSVAWHAYTGEPSMISKVRAAHPDAEMYDTEGSTDYNDPHYQDDWTKWSKTYTDVLNNWCRAAVAWNMATDEHGKPNIGPYPCGGILIITRTRKRLFAAVSTGPWRTSRARFNGALGDLSPKVKPPVSDTSRWKIPAARKYLYLRTLALPARSKSNWD